MLPVLAPVGTVAVTCESEFIVTAVRRDEEGRGAALVLCHGNFDSLPEGPTPPSCTKTLVERGSVFDIGRFPGKSGPEFVLFDCLWIHPLSHVGHRQALVRSRKAGNVLCQLIAELDGSIELAGRIAGITHFSHDAWRQRVELLRQPNLLDGLLLSAAHLADGP
jgi:hypothetical protein